MRWLSLLAVAALTLSSGAAKALVVDVIDFETLASVSSVTVGKTYDEDGYRLTDLTASNLSVVGSNDSDFSGSTAMHNDRNNGVTEIRRLDGKAFNLLSIDLSELFDNRPGATVAFTGEKAAGGTVGASFTLSGTGVAPETFLFPNFTTLLAVSWVNANPFHQFDNIVLAAPVPAALPLALSAFGLLGLLGARRR